MKSHSLVLIFTVLLSVWTPSNILAETPPYPPSPVIESVSFDSSSHIELAPGSDNWPVTWADDNKQYTSWGDGGGFSGDNTVCRTSIGFASITGDDKDTAVYADICGDTVCCAYDCETVALSGKSYGIISINGILYAWWGPGSNVTCYTETRLLKSTDHAATWTKSSWDLTDEAPTIIMPTILNYGQDYTGNTDGYVYFYSIRKVGNPGSLGVHDDPTYGGRIDLARVTIANIEDKTKYEWFTGLNGDDATWGTAGDESVRTAVFTDPNGVGWNVSVSYNAGLDRYFLMTEHTQTFQGNLGIFDGPEPWGPWTTVGYYSNWENFGSTFFWNFSNKWLSADGKDFVIVFTGTGGNDSLNIIEGSFVLKTAPAAPTGLHIVDSN